MGIARWGRWTPTVHRDADGATYRRWRNLAVRNTNMVNPLYPWFEQNCTELNANNLKPTVDQVMVWWRQATSHYLSKCWSDLCHHTVSLGRLFRRTDQRNHQSAASLALYGEFTGDRWIPHKRPVTRKLFSFDDVITSPVSLFSKIAVGMIGTWEKVRCLYYISSTVVKYYEWYLGNPLMISLQGYALQMK